MKKCIVTTSPFKPHLEIAQQIWKSILTKEECAIDATCGNGHDTVKLAALAKTVYAFDIQSEAIRVSKDRVSEHKLDNVHFYQQCHSSFPSEITDVRLIVYNLGYLPGCDKNITTLTPTTLKSLENACNLIKPGGMITVTCYPGHEEGQIEEKKILEWAEQLNPSVWQCCHRRFINKIRSPSLLSLQKSSTSPA